MPHVRGGAGRFDVETGEQGEQVTEVEISDVRFGERWPASLFAPPEDAHVVERIAPPER